MPLIGKLTAQSIQAATSKIGDGGGLWLEVKKTGTKSWVYRYRLHGRDREMGLGAWPDVSLKSAREKASNCRALKAEGIDPIENRNQEKNRLILEQSRNKTFVQCVDEYLTEKSSEWKNPKHRQQWRNTLYTYAVPIMGDMPVKEIGIEHVLKVLKPIWNEKTETASRVRLRINKVLDWATVMKYREGLNPASWDGNLKEVLASPAKIKQAKNHAALHYSDVPELITKLDKKETIGAYGLKLCILTATRTGEVIGAKWSEIDFDAEVWTIPKERMKAKKEHQVPLSESAIQLLKKIPRQVGNDYVFTGLKHGKPISNMAMLKLLKQDLGYENYTVHGFRSSFRDWGAEQTSYPREVQEAALAHQLKDKSEAAYARSNHLEKRRLLMMEWDKYLAGKV